MAVITIFLIGLFWMNINVSAEPFLESLSPRPGASQPLRLKTTSRSNLVHHTIKNSSILGAEIALTGRGNNTRSDVLGLNMAYGLRLTALIPFVGVYAKPSLGYFRKTEGTQVAGVTQNNLEGGLNIYFANFGSAAARILLGVAQKLDIMFSKIWVQDVSVTSPPILRYRAGPGAGLQFLISNSILLGMDLEVSFPLRSPVETHGAFSTGVYFLL